MQDTPEDASRTPAQEKSGGGRRDPGFGGRRGILWLVLAVAIVVTASAAAILLARRDEGDRRWRLYGQGVDAYETGSYGLAAEIFDRYLDRYGDYAPARYMLGVSLDRLDRGEEAVAEVLRASRQDPDLDEASLFLAARAFENGRPRDALSFAEQALASPPLPGDAHLIAGLILGQHEFRDVTAAIEHLELAEKDGVGTIPSRLLLVELLGEVRAAFPDRVDAAHWSELANRVDEGLRGHLTGGAADRAIWRRLARLALATDSPAKALDALSNCRRLGDESPEYWALLARAALAAGDAETGAAAVRQALGLDIPLDTVTELAVFLGERRVEDLEAAAVARARELYGEQPVFILWHVRWLLSKERTEEATAEADAAAARWPEDDDVALLRADAAARAGANEAAAGQLRALVSAGRAASAARLRLADLLLSREGADPDRLGRVRELIEASESTDGPGRTGTEFLRGRLALREGLLEEARGHLAAAVSRDPMRPRYHVQYADLLLRSGDATAAMAEISAAVRLRGEVPGLLVLRAKAAMDAGRGHREAARRDLLAVLDREPENEGAVRLLARLAADRRGVATEDDLARLYRTADAEDASARVLLEVGACALARGDPEKAADLAERAERAATDAEDRWDAVELRARILERRNGSGQSEVEALLHAEGAGATSPAERARYGWALLERGDPAGAKEQARKILAVDPDRVLALRLRFETCFAEGADALDEAANLADRIARAARGRADEFYAKGKLALARGERAEARDLLKRALALAPGDYYAACFLGRALFELDEWEEAEVRLERAVELRPDFRTARAYLAELLVARGAKALDDGRESAAANDFLRADDLAPEDGRGALGFARAVLDESLRDNTMLRRQARDRLRRAIDARDGESAPEEDDLLAGCLLAESKLAMFDRDWSGAASSMGAYLKLHPDDEGAVLHRALALMFEGEGAVAIEELRALVAAVPDSWPATAILGEAYLRADRPGDAEALFRGWLSTHESDPAASRCLAVALDRQGRRAAAVDLLAEALVARPGAVACAESLVALATGPELRSKAAKAIAGARERTGPSGDLRYLGTRVTETGDAAGAEVFERCLEEGFRSLALEVDCTADLLRTLSEAGEGPSAVDRARRFLTDLVPRIERSRTRLSPRRLAVAWEMAGVALYGERDLETAERCFRRACDLWPGYALGANNLAYLVLDRPVPPEYGRREADLEEAEGLARRAVKVEPDNPDYLDTLGAVLLEQGRAAEAATELEKAAELLEGRGAEETVVRTWIRLAEARARSGDADAAQRALGRAAEKRPDVTKSREYRKVSDLLKR